MITSIEISNFRCYERVSIDKCARLNVIVGDNGAGKTALIEAIFLALGNSPELSTRFRALRGLETNLSGSVPALERALWRDMFHKGDMARPVFVKLNGSGQERRSVRVSRSEPTIKLVSLKDPPHMAGVYSDDYASGLKFSWTDSKDNKHVQRVTVTGNGLNVEFIEGTHQERHHDLFFYIASAGSVNGTENATRFSELSVSGAKAEFLDVFRQEYPWIKDITIEMSGGVGALFATVDRPYPATRPLAYVSGGINRVMSILLCIASARNGIVLVDEVDNGIYHEHHEAVWRMIVAMCQRFNVQLVMSTHSMEWLEAMTRAADKCKDDVALWRVRRLEGSVEVRQFGGKQAFVAIESGTEVR